MSAASGIVDTPQEEVLAAIRRVASNKDKWLALSPQQKVRRKGKKKRKVSERICSLPTSKM
jgi:hypothetical protein